MKNGTISNGQPTVAWAALSGRWNFQGTSAQYLEGPVGGVTEGKPLPIGLAISSLQMQDGLVRTRIKFRRISPDPQAGGIVLGYRSNTERYLLAQLGASNSAYSISEFDPAFGWRPLVIAGSKSNLRAEQEYSLELSIVGQRVKFSVDGVRVVDQILADPLTGTQLGLIAAGAAEITFSEFTVSAERPRVFVAMQFGEPFDTIYREVIREEGKKLDLDIVRIDELAGPGIIFEDIKRNIAEAKIVIAEITAPNQNVFYELGYAHALNKPTILLAKRGIQLPFDIRSYRVIFYDDSIGGKPEVERNLNKHLRAVLQEDL